MLYSLSEASNDGQQSDRQLAEVIEHLESNANLTRVLQGENNKIDECPLMYIIEKFKLLIVWDMAIYFIYR